MGDYRASKQINTAPQALFDFLSDIDNLPRYFSRMTSATPRQGEEVQTSAELPDGQQVSARAWFHRDPDDRHLAWGSEGPNDYRGHLHVREHPSGSEVEVHLHTVRVGDDDAQVQQGLEDTLATLKHLTE